MEWFEGSWVRSAALLYVAHMFSRLMCSRMRTKKEQRTTTWLAVHAIVNLSISIQVLPSMRAVYACTASNATETCLATLGQAPQPMQEAGLLHLYHVLFYNLSGEDIFHHALFASGLILPGIIYDWGPLANHELFYIHGFPGFLIYAYIVARRLFRWPTSIEPLLSALVNVFVRMPGILYSSWLLFRIVPFMTTVPMWAIALNLALAPANAVYYAHQSTNRYLSRR